MKIKLILVMMLLLALPAIASHESYRSIETIDIYSNGEYIQGDADFSLSTNDKTNWVSGNLVLEFDKNRIMMSFSNPNRIDVINGWKIMYFESLPITYVEYKEVCDKKCKNKYVRTESNQYAIVEVGYGYFWIYSYDSSKPNFMMIRGYTKSI